MPEKSITLRLTRLLTKDFWFTVIFKKGPMVYRARCVHARKLSFKNFRRNGANRGRNWGIAPTQLKVFIKILTLKKIKKIKLK